jgi:hypothetical protein
MPTPLYDLVKGAQGDPAPQPYNVKWEDEARESAAADNPVADTAIDRSATTTDVGDVFTLNNHGMADGTRIKLTGVTTTTGITAGTTYFVVGATTNTFQVSLTEGGSAVALTTNGSATFILAPNAIVGTPLTPAHYFDRRDGAVTADPVLVLP